MLSSDTQKKGHCLLKNGEITDSACAEMVINLDADSLAKCRTDCPRGVAMAKSAANWRGAASAVDSAVAACLAPVTKPPTAWELVVGRTGCDTQEKLGKKIGARQSRVSQMFVKLTKGIMPQGRPWDRLLEITGYMPEELLLAANPKAQRPQAPVEAKPAGKLELHTEHLPAAPEPTGGTVAVPPYVPGEVVSEGLPPLSQHLMDAAELEAADTVPTLMGADPAEQLMDAEELAELRQPAAIPPDFVPYTGARPSIINPPALSIKKGGDIELSSSAVESFGLAGKRLVRPHWSGASKRIGLALEEQQGPGVLKLQSTTRSQRLRISGGGFFRAFGLDLEPGTYPLALDPSGLLVATITNAPAQSGGEA
ncbi:hypothetical protein [Humidesulfovibrio idahonensis]